MGANDKITRAEATRLARHLASLRNQTDEDLTPTTAEREELVAIATRVDRSPGHARAILSGLTDEFHDALVQIAISRSSDSASPGEEVGSAEQERPSLPLRLRRLADGNGPLTPSEAMRLATWIAQSGDAQSALGKPTEDQQDELRALARRVGSSKGEASSMLRRLEMEFRRVRSRMDDPTTSLTAVREREYARPTWRDGAPLSTTTQLRDAEVTARSAIAPPATPATRTARPPAPSPQPFGVSDRGAEKLAAAWMLHLGTATAVVTQQTRDGGVDVDCRLVTGDRVIVQVKNIAAGSHVPEPSIRELMGTALANHAAAVLFTSGRIGHRSEELCNEHNIAVFRYDAEEGTCVAHNRVARQIVQAGGFP